MSAFLDAIGTVLEAANVAGGSSGWALTDTLATDTPDRMVTLYETGGPDPEHASDRTFKRPTFQAVARCMQAYVASTKATDVLDALDGATVDGFGFFRATQSTPVAIGQDEDGRWRFVVNFRGGEA